MPERILYIARSGEHLNRDDPDYVAAGREGNECGAVCPREPNYQCTRDRDHDGDHAAHGWRLWKRSGVGGREIVMFARWSQQ